MASHDRGHNRHCAGLLGKLPREWGALMSITVAPAPTYEVTYRLEWHPEEMAPDFDDPETLAWIERELAYGNEWAWFSARVVATMTIGEHTFEGADWLGGCSYESEADFRACGYYADMCSAARERLLANLKTAVDRGNEAWHALHGGL